MGDRKRLASTRETAHVSEAMHSLPAQFLALILAVSELWIGLSRRSGTASKKTDRSSLRLLVTIITACVTLAMLVRGTPGEFLAAPWVQAVGAALFAAGLILRWMSILRLGRFFTVDVTIATDHRLMTGGPYRWVRHPSYTGLLAMLAGLGLVLGNWVSLGLLTVPVTAALLYRIHIEEDALRREFGEEYRAYEGQTKRLIPFIY